MAVAVRSATVRAERPPRSVRECAREYLAREFAPLPVPARSKNPGRARWQEERCTFDDVDGAFEEGGNIGLLTGAPSNGLVDVDLDAPETIAAAPFFLPATEMRHGRPSKRASHYWYRSEPSLQTIKFVDPARKDGSGKTCTLVELRSTGAQTIVPPSLHEDTGERIEWEVFDEPAHVSAADLRRAVARVAACAVVAFRWPSGARHDAALALAGLLLRGGLAEHDAERFVEAVARVAGDREWRDRARAVRDTAAELAAGKRTTGAPRLAELLTDGAAVVDRLRQWLELRTAEDTVDRPALCVVNIAEFLSRSFPPRVSLLVPWLPQQGIVLVHGWRGVGKTFFDLGVAVAVVTARKFLKWAAPAARRVLYIDGEMPAPVMQERLARIFANAEAPPDPDYLRLLTPDLQAGSMPDLSTTEGQAALEPHLDGVDLIIVDNISTICRSGVENDAESWLSAQGWALTQRRLGRAVLFVHHDSKDGRQRGTSKREDVLDTVIALKRPADYRASDGARFEVHFEKNRGFYGAEAEPFEAALTDEDGRLRWTIKSIEERTTERVAALLGEGMTQRDVAKKLGVGVGTVSRHAKKARGRGLLDG
jgi:AAA domain/Bifunctional DNA primase/polymerase, N-terminal